MEEQVKSLGMKFFVVIFALGLTSCATTLHSIPTNYAMGTNEESVVIGHVAIDLSGGSAIKPIGFFDRLSNIQVAVANETTGKSYEIVCDLAGSDSDFYVALPAGGYRITKIKKAQLESSPPGRFTVGNGQVIYIGTLKFAGAGLGTSIAASMGSSGARLSGNWLVEDEYPVAVKSFREKYPQMNQEVVKSLLAQ